MVAQIRCTYCSNLIYHCTANHQYTNAIAQAVCVGCYSNGTYFQKLKIKYFLIETTIYNQEKCNRQAAESGLAKLKQQQAFNDSVIFGLLVNTPTKSLAAKFIDFRDRMLKEIPDMRAKLNESVQSMLERTERAVADVIADEVRSLCRYVENEDQMFQRSLSKLEKAKSEISTMIKESVLEDSEGRMAGLVFSSDETNELVQLLNNKIAFFINKHASLRQLLNQGDATITSANRYQPQPIIIQVEEQDDQNYGESQQSE